MADEKKIERMYVIPLRNEWRKVPSHKRAKKAVRAVREFLAKHMKTDVENVKVGKWLNQELWKRGMKHPAGKIKIKAVKEGDIVKAELAELSEKAKKIEEKEKLKGEKYKSEKEKKKEEEKKEKEAKEAAKEEIKETPEEKEKEEKEKIMHKPVEQKEEHIPTSAHEAAKTKPFRQSLKK